MELKNLKSEIDKLKKEVKVDEPDQKKGSSSIGIAMKMGTEFVAAVFVAGLIGFQIDKYLEYYNYIFYYWIGCGHIKCCEIF